jgi:hypothetical protein
VKGVHVGIEAALSLTTENIERKKEKKEERKHLYCGRI